MEKEFNNENKEELNLDKSQIILNDFLLNKNTSQIKWSNLNIKYNKLKEKNKAKKMPYFYDFYDFNDFNNVYEPAEDTFLMSDTLEEEIKSNIFNDFKKLLSCEIGCGSSFSSICFVEYFTQQHSITKENYTHFCTDINKDALSVSKKVIDNTKHKEYFKLIESSFLESNIISDSLSENIEALILFFNPPYVTTDKEELKDALLQKDIVASWAGGVNGSEVLHDFTKYFCDYLRKLKNNNKTIKTVFLYLLLSSENEYNKIIKDLLFFDYEVECSKIECCSTGDFKNEKLGIFKFVYSFKK